MKLKRMLPDLKFMSYMTLFEIAAPDNKVSMAMTSLLESESLKDLRRDTQKASSLYKTVYIGGNELWGV